jgi:hypothetical protein
MKYILILFSFLYTYSFSQKVIPFVDFNNYFRSFEENNFKVLEMQQIKEFKAGDDLVAYIDTRGNLRVYDGETRQDISNMNVNYQVSDHLMAYSIGLTLNMWDAGKLRTLTYNSNEYKVMDSIIVFEDTRFNSVSAYWNKQIFPLYTLTGDQYMPVAIGENIVAFKDNGNFYKVFWNGQIYELGVWNGSIDFQVGTDVLCFNDPTERSFAVFENGQFLNVESVYMKNYKAGRGFIVYEDLNSNLIYYKNGKKETLTNFSASFWEVKDDIVVWGENGSVYAYQDQNKLKVCPFIPADYLLKNNVFAFRNVMGGVSALVNGTVKELSNMPDAEFQIYGNAVLVKLFNSTFLVYKNGRIFQG